MLTVIPGSVLSSAMGLTPPTLNSHVDRGTATPPDAVIQRSNSVENAWAADTAPALTALGFSALVPASDLAREDLTTRSEYICPARSTAHLGHFDDVGHVGFVSHGRISFHRTESIFRIGYLDPVRRREGMEDGWVSGAAARAAIDDSSLGDHAKVVLEDAVRTRTDYLRRGGDGHGELVVNPLDLAVYRVDSEPVVTDVTTDQVIRRFRFTTDAITPDTTSVALTSLDGLAGAA